MTQNTIKPKIGDYVTEKNGLFLAKVNQLGLHSLCIGNTAKGLRLAIINPVVVEDPVDFLVSQQLRLQIGEILESNIWPEIAAGLKERMGI